MANSTDNVDDGWSENLFIAENQYSNLFAKKLLSDVTLVVGVDKKRIPGHKFILSQCSWEFFNVFHNIKLDKDELLIEDVTEEIFLCFLKFCYTRKLELDGIDGLAVLKLAYRFKVKHLIEKCETHLLELVKRDNCLEFYTKSSFLNQNSLLKEKISNQIEYSFAWLTSEEDQKRIFNTLPLKALKEIVDLENLRCDEMLLFDGIINWAKFNCEKNNISCEPKNLRRILGIVFYKIRFPTMKIDWFAEIISDYLNLFTAKEISDIIKDIKSDKKTNSKFSHKLRKRGYAFVEDPFTFEWGIMGSRIKCFPGPLQLSNDSSSEMSLKFDCNYSRCLGFAFIGKRSQTRKIITCQLKRDVDSNQRHMETEMKCYWNLNWDYCLQVVVFKQKQYLENQYFYELYCKLDCDMVNVKLDWPNSTHFYNTDGISISKEDYNIIPYLIFE